MTNKPMLSVERDTLEWVLNCWPKEQKGNVQEVIPSQVKELRALLDEPAEPFNPQGWSIDHSAGRPILMHNKCSVIEAEQAYGLLNLIESAAQHQGEPVAWVECSPAWLKAGGDCATAPRICVGREGISHLHPAHSSAEQPAPVSMVMPERELYTKYLVGVIPHNANEVNAYKDGWNTCLEEVARLNGVKP